MPRLASDGAAICGAEGVMKAIYLGVGQLLIRKTQSVDHYDAHRNAANKHR
jgi:hypothetical protein